jgi:hypothetical protein
MLPELARVPANVSAPAVFTECMAGAEVDRTTRTRQ